MRRLIKRLAWNGVALVFATCGLLTFTSGFERSIRNLEPTCMALIRSWCPPCRTPSQSNRAPPPEVSAHDERFGGGALEGGHLNCSSDFVGCLQLDFESIRVLQERSQLASPVLSASKDAFTLYHTPSSRRSWQAAKL